LLGRLGSRMVEVDVAFFYHNFKDAFVINMTKIVSCKRHALYKFIAEIIRVYGVQLEDRKENSRM
jgi:hypothetical protein